MKTFMHTTAKASYYNTRAECYEEFNKNNSRAIKALIEKILKEHHVSTVLELTFETWFSSLLAERKCFEVLGSDFSRSLLKIAKQKAKLKQLKIQFLQG